MNCSLTKGDFHHITSKMNWASFVQQCSIDELPGATALHWDGERDGMGLTINRMVLEEA